MDTGTQRIRDMKVPWDSSVSICMHVYMFMLFPLKRTVLIPKIKYFENFISKIWHHEQLLKIFHSIYYELKGKLRELLLKGSKSGI